MNGQLILLLLLSLSFFVSAFDKPRTINQDLKPTVAKWISKLGKGKDQYVLIPQSKLALERDDKTSRNHGRKGRGYEDGDDDIKTPEDLPKRNGEGNGILHKRQLNWILQAEYSNQTFFDDWDFFTAPGMFPFLPSFFLFLWGRGYRSHLDLSHSYRYRTSWYRSVSIGWSFVL